MQIRLSYITTLLAAAAAAAAIGSAPIASAAAAPNPAPVVQGGCTNGVCPNRHTSLLNSAPQGNSQINDSPGFVQYGPQYPYDEGDFIGGYGGYGRGGGWGHGGGFGGGFGGHGGGGHGGGGGR